VSRRRIAGTVGSWRTALRIARREALRARGRTALVLAMIVLPVLALTFTAVSYDMSELTRAERIDRRLGGADAELLWLTDGPVAQDGWGESWAPVEEGAGSRTAPVAADQVTALLPAGSRVTRVRWWAPFEVRIGDRDVSFSGRVLDLTDPLARALVRFRAGRPATAPTEIVVSPTVLRRLGARLGDPVTTADGSGPYTVVGVAEFPDDLGPVVALHPAAGSPSDPAPDTSWLVDLPGRLDGDLVARLNGHGIVVTARTEVAARAPWLTGSGAGARLPVAADAEQLGTGVLVSGLGLLEVVLLVGPAFAVGVRRRRRDLALVAVAGGDAAHLRRIVLADGVVLGGAGAALGVLLGTAAAFAGRPLLEQYVVGARFGGYRCWPAALAVIAGVAVLAGVLAALAPAWTAARQDVMAGLAGRRTAPRHRRRWLLLGLVLVTGGAGLAALGAARTAPTVILGGLILGELGLVFCTPTLVGVLARAGRVLPLAPRIALRDASRNRSSAAPAISAVMAAVAGSVALGVYLTSEEARNAAMYQPSLPYGHVLVTRDDPTDQAPLPPVAQVLGPARAHLGADAVAPLDQARCTTTPDPAGYCSIGPVLPPGQTCPWQPSDQLTDQDRRRARADARCRHRSAGYDGAYFEVVVDDGSALPIITGADPADTAAATAVLRAGGAVVTDPRYLRDSRLTVALSRTDDGSGATATMPGYALRTDLAVDHLVLSRAAADRLGLVTVHSGWAIAGRGVPDQRQQDRFVADLRALGGWQVSVERGRSGTDEKPYLLLLAIASGLITVGAAGIATGLAAAEGRADLSTLAAVGASPRVRRVLSLCQAGVIAVLGSVLGIVAGLGSAVIILASVNRRYAISWPIQDPYPVVVPWLTLGVLVVVPLVAMLGAGLFTRSRLAVERRLD
jgi:putative ABC transport system permease protein